MAQTTIEWTATVLPDGTVLPGYTFNPWVGCTRLSPACDFCYAESWAKRTGQGALWAGERRRTTEANWLLPLKWNREAERTWIRRKVFCASLADVFDNQVPEDWRHDLWTLIASTRHLDWLLLTKHPQNIAKMLPVMDSSQPGYKPWNERWPWRNVWLGTTVDNQDEADRRIPHLLAVPARVRFLSCEPLLGPVDLKSIDIDGDFTMDALTSMSEADIWRSDWAPEVTGEPLDESIEAFEDQGYTYPPSEVSSRAIDWVICGGESGHGARTMEEAWAIDLHRQCASAGVPFFMKQMTKKAPIPDHLMIREWPHVA